MYDNLKNLRGTFEFPPAKNIRVKYALLAVLGIIIVPLAIAAVVFLVLINPTKQFARARDTQRRSSVGFIQNSLERYHVENGKYPSSLEELVPDYLNEIPQDPQTNMNYEYKPVDFGSSYRLCADYEEVERECVNSRFNSTTY